MSGTVLKLRARVDQLEQENAALRSALGLSEATTEESWGAHAPQHLRDQMAASALIAEKLDEPRALIRLGFVCEKNATNRWKPEVWQLAKSIFDTPGVKEILERDMEDAERNRLAIVGRLVRTAMHGTDGESVRAAQQLAKMADWNKGDKPPAAANVTLNLMQMFGAQQGDAAQRVSAEVYDPNEIIEASDFLVHEPGEAALIADEEPQALNR